jgi:DNA-binding response OmpR family regulator
MAETKKTVVCVEDEPDMINLVQFILELKGFKVIGAMGGREGLETIRRFKPDLVLLDLMMPDVSGEEVYRQVKGDKDLKNIPIVIVTADSQGMTKVIWEHVAKANGFLTKPFSTQELLGIVEKVLGRST